MTHVKGNDFSKIQGRFNTRLSLSSASVDEVIKRRILAKTDEAAALLRLVYDQNASGMRNLFTFDKNNTVADLKGYSSEDEFVESYPFVPYQFKLLQDVLVQVRKHGSSGKHLSGGERSMLSAFQEAAQKEKDLDENSFVPFYRFYDTVHTFLDGAIRRVIDRADTAAVKGDGLKREDVDVLKLLFLIRYVDGIAPNIENLATLMIDSIHADKITMRRAIQESLDRLVHENYVSRNGENYLFLTDEEQDINREIRNTVVDPSDVIHMVGQIAFADIYPSRKYRYKGRYDFSFDPMVDSALIGQPSSDIRMRLVTLASDLAENDPDSRLILQSRAGNEAIALLSTEYDYYHELEEVLRITKYIKQRNISQLPESIRKIIQGKGLKKYIQDNYPDCKSDLFSVFIYRNFDFCKPGGYSAFMTPNVWMFIKSHEYFRRYICTKKKIVSLIQIAKGAFYKDATVDVCSFVLQNSFTPNYNGCYLRLEGFKGDMDVQNTKVLEAQEDPNCKYRYIAQQENFAKIPGLPVAYWLTPAMLAVYRFPSLCDFSRPCKGIDTGDNSIFLRLWYEIEKWKMARPEVLPVSDSVLYNYKWFPYNKGGEFRRWYGNAEYLIDFSENGKKIRAFKGSNLRNKDCYLKRGITWSSVTSGQPSMRYFEYGFFFDNGGSCLFAEYNLMYILGFLNCKVTNSILNIAPTLNTQPGDIGRLPYKVDETKKQTIETQVNECIGLSRKDWDSRETSWDFQCHPMI